MTRFEAIVKKSEKSKPEEKLLGVRLEKDFIDDLTRLACRYDVTLKHLVRTVLKEFLNKEMKVKK